MGVVRRSFLPLSLAVALVLALLVGLVPGAFAQPANCPDFFWQNPLPQGNSLLDIAVVDANTAWVVGDYGTIMKTTDGGASWERQVSGTTSVLHAVSAVNKNVAWACGEDDIVLRTTDGGRAWKQLYVLVPGDFNGVDALSDKVAWIVGSNRSGAIIEKTVDGGRNWTDQSPGTGSMVDISAVDSSVAWALDPAGVFYSTTDGGTVWTPHAATLRSTARRLQAFSATRVYGVANCGEYVKTTDGANFTTTSVGFEFDLNGITFTGEQTGWVVGENGFIGVTGDAGASWGPQASGVKNDLLGIGSVGTGQVYACGMSGQLLRLVEPTGAWTRLSSGDTDTLFDATSAGDRTAWACGTDGTILKTGNAGATWVPQMSGTNQRLHCIDAFNAGVVWAGGDNGTILRTTDGGDSWTAVNPGPAAGLDIIGMTVLGPDAVWVSGDDGLIMKTMDGGTTWRKYDQGSHDILNVKAIDAQTAYCERRGTEFLTRTVDGGANWTVQECRRPGYDVDLTGLCVVNENIAYASADVVESGKFGDFGMVFKTTDGGTRWAPTMRHFVNLTLFDVGSADGVNVWACGLFGFTFKSSDGGATWTQQESLESDSQFNAVEAVDGRIAWVVGNGGYILRTTVPCVYSVAPSHAVNTDVERILSISGSGFQPGMEVKLVKGGSTIQGTRVSLISPYSATFRVNLDGAAEGAWDVVATNTNGLEGRLPGAFHVTDARRWFLAEGSTGTGESGRFETWVLIQNPGDRQATAHVTYMTPRGEVAGPDVVLAPESRCTVNAADTLPDTWEVSTKVEADRSIVVERAMYWDSPAAFRASATGSIGSPFASKTWYMAEGSTGIAQNGRFDTYITVANPGDADADVTLTWMTPAGEVPGPSMTVPPGTRWTVDAADLMDNEWSLATGVESTVPVVAERSVYWSAAGRFRVAAHNSIGASGVSNAWFLAEGSTGIGPDGSTFETWIVLQNPTGVTAKARLDYRTPAGEVAGPWVTLAPHSRRTVNVADSVPNEFSVSTAVVSDNPIVAERSTYLDTPAAFRQVAQSSVGASAPSADWDLAEGSTGGGAGGFFETWVLVENPWSVAATVNLTYMTPSGPVPGPALTVGPWSRVSINVGDTVPDEWSVSTHVTSNLGVVAEAAVYWNAPDVPRQCAGDSIGFPL